MLVLLLISLAQAQQCPNIDYSQNGGNWSGLCSSGTKQSPVDLRLANAHGFPHYLFLMYPVINVTATYSCPNYYSLTLSNNADFIAKDESSQSFSYHSADVYFHSPSEHTYSGSRQDLEVQIRFNSSISGSPQFAVFSVLFNSDADPQPNPFFQQVIGSNGQLLSSVSSFTLAGVVTKWTAFAPYYYYKGSLTVPPCSEAVDWYVLATPQRMSVTQLQAFHLLHNNRATQPLNERTLYANSGGVQHSSA